MKRRLLLAATPAAALALGRQLMLNQAAMSRFGIPPGEVTLSFTKR